MLARTLLSIVNLAVLVGTLAIWFAIPQFSTYALYGCLGWVVVAFVLMYSSWGNRPLGAGTTTSMSGGAPLGSGGPVRPPLDFCIYCATSLPVGASRCPACGHAGARG